MAWKFLYGVRSDEVHTDWVLFSCVGLKIPQSPTCKKRPVMFFVFTFLESIYRYFMWLALYLSLLGLNFAVD